MIVYNMKMFELFFSSKGWLLTECRHYSSYDSAFALASRHWIDLQIFALFKPVSSTHTHTQLIIVQREMHRAHQIFDQYGAMRQAFLIFTVETHRAEAFIWAIDITVLRFEGGGGLLVISSLIEFFHLLSCHFEISAHLFKGPFHLQVLL